jgi:hypothetical protein
LDGSKQGCKTSSTTIVPAIQVGTKLGSIERGQKSDPLQVIGAKGVTRNALCCHNSRETDFAKLCNDNRVRFTSSHHLYQRLPWRKHFADLHRWHAGALESIEQGGSISAGNGEQQPAGGLGIEKNGPDFCRDALTIAD